MNSKSNYISKKNSYPAMEKLCITTGSVTCMQVFLIMKAWELGKRSLLCTENLLTSDNKHRVFSQTCASLEFLIVTQDKILNLSSDVHFPALNSEFSDSWFCSVH
jgi:hypothetical protein